MNKKCANPDCGLIKPISEFYKDRSRKDGLSSRCKDCKDESSTRYINTNKGKLAKRKANSKYKKTEKGKVSERKYTKGINFKKSFKKFSKSEKFKINQKRYALTSKGRYKLNSLSAKYRASKLKATPFWLTKQDLYEIEKFYRIAKKAELFFNLPMHVDHIEPLQGKNVCGLHVPWNLEVLPMHKNLSKGNRKI